MTFIWCLIICSTPTRAGNFHICSLTIASECWCEEILRKVCTHNGTYLFESFVFRDCHSENSHSSAQSSSSKLPSPVSLRGISSSDSASSVAVISYRALQSSSNMWEPHKDCRSREISVLVIVSSTSLTAHLQCFREPTSYTCTWIANEVNLLFIQTPPEWKSQTQELFDALLKYIVTIIENRTEDLMIIHLNTISWNLFSLVLTHLQLHLFGC